MKVSRKLRELEDELRAVPHTKAAIAYGSFVRGDDYSERSDIDISVFLDGNFMTPTESYIELSKLNPKYDISPNSVADASSPIGNVHAPDFYEHVVNNHAIIFDDCDIMGTIRSNGGIRASAENELDIGQESMSKMSFYLLRARRRCYRLCKWVPQYGLIEPVIGEVFSFKSALPGFMRSALKSEGIELGKDDYKEVVIHKFYKNIPGSLRTSQSSRCATIAMTGLSLLMHSSLRTC